VPLVTVLVNYISLSEMDSTQNLDTSVRAAAFRVCSTRHIELFAKMLPRLTTRHITTIILS
jgi:hypothetical protein